MIPTAKHLNHFDLSIGEIHCIKFSGVALHRFIQRFPYRRINGGPVYDFDAITLEPEIIVEEEEYVDAE